MNLYFQLFRLKHSNLQGPFVMQLLLAFPVDSLLNPLPVWSLQFTKVPFTSQDVAILYFSVFIMLVCFPEVYFERRCLFKFSFSLNSTFQIRLSFRRTLHKHDSITYCVTLKLYYILYTSSCRSEVRDKAHLCLSWAWLNDSTQKIINVIWKIV